MLGVGQRHFSEETEAYPGTAGSGAETFFGGNKGVSRQCWEWGRYVFRSKQKRIQVILGRGRVTFRRKQRRIQAMQGVGQSLFGGNRRMQTMLEGGGGAESLFVGSRGVAKQCGEWDRYVSVLPGYASVSSEK